MMEGRIVKSGGLELIEKVDREGYDWLKEELGIIDKVETTPRVSLGTCAINKRGENK